MNEQLLADLETPEFYPHPTSREIQLIQTHISVVAIANPYAYKVKKPVDLGFLDFSTLDLRHHYCHEELRLNRRFSPDIYIDVVPIYEDGERFALVAPESESPPVEYAVRMHAFDQDDVLSEWIAHDRLTAEHVDAIARKVACLHAEAPTSPDVAKWGSADVFQETVEENFDAVAPFVGRVVSETDFQALRDDIRNVFSGLREHIQGRSEAGFVRECHGDLHLRNLCWFRGDVHLFDCIEFNDAFRCIDVMYEVAFLAMDLQYRSRPDLAQRLINVYIEQTGDYEGCALLPFFMSIRAYVRAKVACLRLEDPDISDEAHEEAIESARKHFDLAGYCVRRSQPALILTSGIAGSGKSTVAGGMAERLRAIHIRSDAVRKHLAGVRLDSTDKLLYTDAMTNKVYSRLAELGRRLANAGWPVILDATYLRAAQRRLACDAAQSIEAPFAIIFLEIPKEVAQRRIAERAGDVSDAYPDLVEDQVERFEHFDDSDRSALLEVNSTQPIDYDGLIERLRGALGYPIALPE